MRGARTIHAVEKEQISEVKDAGVAAREVEMLWSELGIGAAGVEEGAAARALHSHHIGKAGGRFR
jgi:hypothetical protein